MIRKMASIAKSSQIYGRLAHFFEQNSMRAIFMTAAEIAAELGISQGSVSRFCMALGYRGYADFIRGLQDLVSKKLTIPQRLQYMPLHGGNRMGNVIELEIRNMCRLDSIMRGEAYERLLDFISSADDLVLLSARMSATLLPYLGYILKKMRNSVYEVVPETQDWNMLEYRDPNKTKLIVLAFPRYPRILIDKVRALHDRGFSMAAITDSQLSPVVPLIRDSVFVPITVSSIFDVYSTPMTFFNLLLRDAAARMPSLEERLERIEQQEEDGAVYLGPD